MKQELLDELFLEAVYYCKLSNVKELLDKGANINAVDEEGYSALHYCAGNKNDEENASENITYEEMLKFLLSQDNINVNILNYFEESPLDIAINENLEEGENIISSAGGDRGIAWYREACEDYIKSM